MNLIRKLIDKVTGKDKSTNEVFNSIRINALVTQLYRNGNIDINAYEDEIYKQVKVVTDNQGR